MAAPRHKYKMTEDNFVRLCHAFLLGANVTQACAFVPIHRQTFYRWLEENPGLREEIRGYQSLFAFHALQTINKNLDDPKIAMQVWKLNQNKYEKEDRIPPFNMGDLSDEAIKQRIRHFKQAVQELDQELEIRRPRKSSAQLTSQAVQVVKKDAEVVSDKKTGPPALRINVYDRVRVESSPYVHVQPPVSEEILALFYGEKR